MDMDGREDGTVIGEATGDAKSALDPVPHTAPTEQIGPLEKIGELEPTEDVVPDRETTDMSNVSS